MGDIACNYWSNKSADLIGDDIILCNHQPMPCRFVWLLATLLYQVWTYAIASHVCAEVGPNFRCGFFVVPT